jgi:hypothetical protein
MKVEVSLNIVTRFEEDVLVATVGRSRNAVGRACGRLKEKGRRRGRIGCGGSAVESDR